MASPLLVAALVCLAAAAGADVDAKALAPFENQKVTAIVLTGHKATKEFVITREIETLVGEPFKVETALEDYQRLENLSIFAEIGLSAEADAGGVKLTFVFKEMPSYIPFLGFSYTEENGFSVGPGLSSLNLFGRDMSVSATAYFGGADQYKLAYSWPWITGDHVSLDFFGARLTRTDTLNEFEETSYEFTPQVGRYLTEKGRIRAKFSLFEMGSDVDGKTLDPDNHDNLLRLGVSVGWDTRDSWTIPRKGWKNELEIWKTGFGGEGDFWTVTLDLRNYVPIGRRQRLMLSGLASLQNGEVGVDIPQYMIYRLGGANSIRGYSLNDLGRRLYGKSQLLGTVEYSFNLIPLRSWSISKFAFRLGLDAAVFTDGGIAWSTPDEFQWKRGKAGLGAGLRLLVPGTEMVRFDVAWSEQGGFQFHFAGGPKPQAQRNRLR
jgi:outer membrane protein assembly factor BamA